MVCEECGGYYELEPGESPEEFKSCECGGKLRYEEKIFEKVKESESSISSPEKSRLKDKLPNWWKKQSRNRRIVITYASIMAVIFIIVFIWTSATILLMKDTESTNYNHASPNTTTNSSPAPAQLTSTTSKIQEIENSPDLKTSLNQFASEVYDEPGENPIVKNIKVLNVISDNEIKLSFDVVSSNAYGDKVTATYTGTWTKSNGVWREDPSDLQRSGGYNL